MSERDPRNEELDAFETARQVHTLAQRLLQRVASDAPVTCETQPDTSAASNDDDLPVTYWYP